MTENLRQKWQNIVKYRQKYEHKNLSPFAHNSILTKTQLKIEETSILRTILKTFAWKWRHNLLFHSFNRKHMKTNAIFIHHNTECKKSKSPPISSLIEILLQETSEMQMKDLNPFYCPVLIDLVKFLLYLIYLPFSEINLFSELFYFQKLSEAFPTCHLIRKRN